MFECVRSHRAIIAKRSREIILIVILGGFRVRIRTSNRVLCEVNNAQTSYTFFLY